MTGGVDGGVYCGKDVIEHAAARVEADPPKLKCGRHSSEGTDDLASRVLGGRGDVLPFKTW